MTATYPQQVGKYVYFFKLLNNSALSITTIIMTVIYTNDMANYYNRTMSHTNCPEHDAISNKEMMMWFYEHPTSLTDLITTHHRGVCKSFFAPYLSTNTKVNTNIIERRVTEPVDKAPGDTVKCRACFLLKQYPEILL